MREAPHLTETENEAQVKSKKIFKSWNQKTAELGFTPKLSEIKHEHIIMFNLGRLGPGSSSLNPVWP